MLIEYEIRDLVADDRNMILSSWLRSFRNNGDWPRHVDSATYYANHQRIVAALLEECDVRVAFAKDDPNLLQGWCGVDGYIVHYVFVKEQYRKMGIAKRLLEDVGGNVVYTHWTRTVKELSLAGKLQGWIHNPYALFGLEAE